MNLPDLVPKSKNEILIAVATASIVIALSLILFTIEEIIRACVKSYFKKKDDRKDPVINVYINSEEIKGGSKWNQESSQSLSS